MKRIVYNPIILLILMLAIIFMAIGYATISDVKLNISGEAQAPKSSGAYLPEGFTKVEGTTLESGLTIQDSTGNQYVWVEVPKTEEVYPTAGLEIKDFTDAEYTLIENDLHTYTSAYRKSGWRDSGYGMGFVLSNKQYTELKQKMLKSVYENEGFYVGKYETGVEGSPRTSGSESEDPTEIPVIKPNAYPYNFVTFGQAQTLATNIESGEYTSSLLFGVQWDLMLKYLEIKGATETELNNDSTNWGNYANSVWNVTNTNSKYSTDDEGKNWITKAYGSKAAKTKVLLSTGASDIFSKQGIYDIAGNVSEWTLESTTDLTTPVSVRGGYYIYNGNREPANYHEWGYDLATDAVIGFRITLY